MNTPEVILTLSSIALLIGSLLSRQAANDWRESVQARRDAMRYYEECMAALAEWRKARK